MIVSGMQPRLRLWIVATLCPLACAQVRVAGRVTNETNVPVAGARITAESASLSKSFDATSDPTGAFELLLPEPGAYSLKIDREGFYIHNEPPMPEPARPASASMIRGELLFRVTGKEGDKGLSILSSHPLTEDRLARMSSADRPPSSPPLLTAEEWTALKAICSASN